MPELPDVEGFRRFLARHASGRRIEGVSVPNPAILRNTTPQAIGRALAGCTLARPRRIGKWLLAPADGYVLLLHFGMTGLLSWNSARDRRHRHDRLILRLDGGDLRYRNMRMLGGVWLARDEAEVRRITGPLGPDAGRIERGEFEALLEGSTAGTKALLMNQQRVAGIGNELSDEILWRARVHPARRASSLERGERRRIHRALREVIAASNRHGRIPVENRWLRGQRGRRNPRCPRCRTPIERSTIAGRTAYWCPDCQPRPPQFRLSALG
jgi:formamidopyrimidine-DNA glycosylase